MLRVAIVGCGAIASKHVQSLSELREEAVLTAICDVDGERLERFAETVCRPQYPEVRLFRSVEELLEQSDAELVAVTTSSDAHAPLAIRALRSGRHVLVEKPLALSMAEAREAVEQARLHGKLLAVSYQVRYLPQIRALKEAADNGDFGFIAQGVVSMRWNRSLSYYKQSPWRESWAKGGGLFMNQCIHYIDLLQWLMGPVKSVYAQALTFGQPIKVENAGAVILRFRNGGIGIVEASAGIYPRSLGTSLSLFGDSGSATIKGGQFDEIEQWNFRNPRTNRPDGRDRTAKISHTPLYRDLARAIRTGGSPLSAGDTALAANEIVLAAYRSIASGAAVELPLDHFDMRRMDRME